MEPSLAGVPQDKKRTIMKKLQFTLGMAVLLMAASVFNASAQGPWGSKLGKQYKGQIIFTDEGMYKFGGENLNPDLIKTKLRIEYGVSFIAHFKATMKSLGLEGLNNLSWAVWVDGQRVHNTLNINACKTIGWYGACFNAQMLSGTYGTGTYKYIPDDADTDAKKKNSGSVNFQDIFPLLKSGSTHKIKVAVIKLEYFNKEVPEEAIYCSGEFDLVCDAAKYEEFKSKYEKAKDDAIVKLNKAYASMPEVEKELARQFIETWGNTQVTVRIMDPKWKIIRHTYGGQILSKELHVGLSYKDPDGQCMIKYGQVSLAFDEPKKAYEGIDKLNWIAIAEKNHWCRYKPQGKTDCSNIE